MGVAVTHSVKQSKLHWVVNKPQPIRKNEKKIAYEYLKTIKAKLSDQSLDSLQYVGMLKNDNQIWGLIRQSNNLISVVKRGDYIAREHVLVVNINSYQLNTEKTSWTKQGLKTEGISLPCHHQHKNKGH